MLTWTARILAVPLLLIGASACATPPEFAPRERAPLPVQPAAASSAIPPQARPDAAEADILRQAMAREVPHLLAVPPGRQQTAIGFAARSMAAAGAAIDHPQLVLAVDRNPAVQELLMVLARPGAEPWEVIGGTHVSTGKPGRREHFKTAVGVFLNDASILGYRAEGTYNGNHIRGLGVKNMRVWDFGWQSTEDWHHPGAVTQIRLEMHATDPSVLEPRIGRPDSEGCVRIPAALNRFLDRHGVIDADLEREAVTDRRFRALLPADREPTPLAGHPLVVYDSSGG